jgi:hypothetical protein
MIPLNFDASIRVEYGDENFFPSTYDVRSIMHGDDVTRVLLQAPETTCKARVATNQQPRRRNVKHVAAAWRNRAVELTRTHYANETELSHCWRRRVLIYSQFSQYNGQRLASAIG